MGDDSGHHPLSNPPKLHKPLAASKNGSNTFFDDLFFSPPEQKVKGAEKPYIDARPFPPHAQTQVNVEFRLQKSTQTAFHDASFLFERKTETPNWRQNTQFMPCAASSVAAARPFGRSNRKNKSNLLVFRIFLAGGRTCSRLISLGAFMPWQQGFWERLHRF
jgi:hypothetical protein